MANFTRTQLDAVWISGYQPPDSDFEDLDRKAFQGVNGKVGGVYAPTAPIIVDGLGLTLTAPLQIRGSGLLRLESGATLLLNDGDYQDLGTGHVGRSRYLRSHRRREARRVGRGRRRARAGHASRSVGFIRLKNADARCDARFYASD
jgi:hypothetical protein